MLQFEDQNQLHQKLPLQELKSHLNGHKSNRSIFEGTKKTVFSLMLIHRLGKILWQSLNV